MAEVKAFSLADVTPEDTQEQPEVQRAKRQSRFENSPAKGWLTDSYERDISKTFEIPNDSLEAVVKELRGAAKVLTIGVTIARLPSKKKDHTKLTFKARPKRQYTVA